jgi:hypothetical protein
MNISDFVSEVIFWMVIATLGSTLVISVGAFYVGKGV